MDAPDPSAVPGPRDRLLNGLWDLEGLIGLTVSAAGWWLSARPAALDGFGLWVVALALGGGLGIGGLRRGGQVGQVSGLAAMCVVLARLAAVYSVGHPTRMPA